MTQSYKDFIQEEVLSEASMWAPYAKTINSIAWLKKNKSKFHHVMTTTGQLSVELSPADRVAGKPSMVSKAGMANFRARLKNIYSEDVGVNIATQTVDFLDDKKMLVIINKMATQAMSMGSYDGVEK